ncbi:MULTISPECIES: carbon-nitrogen family hydrolase [unclassified Nannocystis]|uniref:carbon-nitrogen family hydrolase n=1 Tax=Nannocystis TaxID=53 RepID=UPI0022722480|nr:MULTISPECIES: carbon-nitrogen family hydrolase [unclassified Nannocystis]MCY0993762.1 carbon-nitrogen family hydrolase [Nannocystis sp. ILAH1]MCY1065874.1 carbon-nitrogen family hydrolase [Nannocystis sp. RBIL2]
MKIAAIQSDIAWEDPEANFTRLRPWVAAAAAAGAKLVVLPEMFACGFSMTTAKIAEPPGGPSTRFLEHQARQHDLWICGSVPEVPLGEAKPYNTLVLASPHGQVVRYRKIHPFSFAKEHEHYGAGSDHITVDVEGLRCTLFVCYDLRFADEFWGRAEQTDAYVVVANWPERRRHHWTTLLQARAIENQAYVVGVNRVGHGNGLDYSGDSRIVDPWGEVLAAAAGGETMVLADVRPEVVRDARERFPVLKDRRKP